MSPEEFPGIVTLPSKRSVDEIVERLTALLAEKELHLFAIIPHDAGARKAGLEMPPSKLLIFGSPKHGTALMVAAPTAAIDLPLKILVWQDSGGKVWVSYNSPEYLRARHGFPEELVANIAGVAGLAAASAS